MSDREPIGVVKRELPEFEVVGPAPSLSLDDTATLLKMIRTAKVDATDVERAYRTILKLQKLYNHLKAKQDAAVKRVEESNG